MQPDSEAGPPHPEARPSLRRELFNRTRLTVYGASFLAELVVFFVAVSIPADQASQQETLRQASGVLNLAGNPDSLGVFAFIFSHNTLIALGDSIPGFGAFVLLISMFAGGQVVQAFAASYGVPGALVGLVLFLFPYSFVEFLGYAVAFGAGVMLIMAWPEGRVRVEARVFVLEVLVAGLILMMAAAMETATLASAGLGFALWIPTIGIGLLYFLKLRRRRL